MGETHFVIVRRHEKTLLGPIDVYIVPAKGVLDSRFWLLSKNHIALLPSSSRLSCVLQSLNIIL